ncbi:hypothetical protein HK405_011936 [Cladochytrium tenue]|nr:hypothetical protein HK405_011936 [Cladochytrium tenue]
MGDSAFVSATQIPEGFVTFNIVRCPENLTELPTHSLALVTKEGLSPPETCILTGVLEDVEQTGCLLFLRHTPDATFFARATFGQGVTLLEIGEPYESVVLTGHNDHFVKVWDLQTGEALVVVQGPDSRSPVLGLGWVDEPEAWLSHGNRVDRQEIMEVDLEVTGTSLSGRPSPLSRPRGSALVSFADIDSRNGTEPLPGGDFAVWDLGRHIRRARSEHMRRLEQLARTVSAPASSTAASEASQESDVIVRRLTAPPSTSEQSIGILSRHAPPIGSAARRLPPVRLSSLNIPVVARHRHILNSGLADDAVATFTVMHPVIALLTVDGTLVVLDIESGEVLARVPRAGGAPASSLLASSAGHDLFKTPGIVRCPSATAGEPSGVMLLLRSGIVKITAPGL